MGVSIHALLAECDLSPQGRVGRHGGFNPRTPCGVRPRAGLTSHGSMSFQSTHSLRSATMPRDSSQVAESVSIHALLAECDRSARAGLRSQGSFNPRTPCGVRLGYGLSKEDKGQFQSTHSLRSATSSGGNGRALTAVSIHALLAECDRIKACLIWMHLSFNPRTPCGVRLRLRLIQGFL